MLCCSLIACSVSKILIWLIFVDDIHNLSYIHSSFQVREMVEIITREFIQMAGSAGEVVSAS